MKLSDDYMYDSKLYIVISNSGVIIECFGNEENAYSFAIRECFKYIDENDDNKHIFEDIYNVDSDESANYTKKLDIIHKNWSYLIKTEMDYHDLVNVEEHELNIQDIFV